MREGRIEGHSTDAAILDGLAAEQPAIIGDGGSAAAFRHALPHAAQFSRRGSWPPDVRDAELVVNATSERDEVVVEVGEGQTLIDLPYPETATARAAAAAGARVDRRPRRAGSAGRCVVRALDRPSRSCRRDAPRSTLRRVSTLDVVTAGESHGPALVAVVTGLPAGLVLDREAIDADLRRRQQGYGRSPRQQIETDEVEVLAGLRHGRTLGTPLALVVRNADHANWAWA